LSSPSQTQGSATWIAGRYRIERAIAEGGMGSVYAVRDEKTGATLALKRARGVEQHPHLVELFEREYRTLASLSHPRIIRVHDYGVDGGSPFYTMDLVQGRDLHELSPLPLEKACHYLRDVATCLALLHARRLLHRGVAGAAQRTRHARRSLHAARLRRADLLRYSRAHRRYAAVHPARSAARRAARSARRSVLVRRPRLLDAHA
jgi:hypothetical protein